MAYPKLEVKNKVLKKGVHLLTSDYKTRNKKRPDHSGMDLIGGNNSLDTIVAIDDGIVSSINYDSKSGYYIFIKHENGYRSFYCHLKKNSILVKKGDKVSKGQDIAFMGATGKVSGAHLHFGVRDKKNNRIDPKPYLTGEKNFNKTTKTNEDKKEEKSEVITYTVKKGDTLSSIAKKYKTTYKKIYNDNKKIIDSENKKRGVPITKMWIYPGQKLVIK